MKNLQFFVKQFEESDENDLISNAKKLIQVLNKKDSDIEIQINHNQPKFLFSTNTDLEISLCDRIFHVCCNRSSLLECKSNWKILITLITQMASFDFKYFVDNYVPLMIKFKEKMLFILAYVASIILNPLSGFLHHVLSSQQYFDQKKKYDFFNYQSPDLNTPIGQTLTKFRKIVIDQIFQLKSTKRQRVSFNSSSSIYTYSIFYPYEHSEIFFNSNYDEISIGFSEQNEILYISSFFLNQEIFTKEKRYLLQNNDSLILWEKYFTEITGLDVHQKIKEIPLFNMTSNDKVPILFQYLKLIPFLALSSLQMIFDDEMELIAQILGEDPISASFYQCLCQVLILTDEKFSIQLFDSILKVCDNLGSLSNNQYHTLIHSICRFIDALSIHQNCKLNNKYFDKFNSLALVGFCSIHVEIRKASLKLIKALGKLNSSLSPFFDFIESSGELFELFISDFFENCERISSLISPSKKKPKSQLTLKIAINSPSPTIWQVFLIAFGKAATIKFPSETVTKFKELITSVFNLPDTELEAQLKISQNLTINYNMSSSLSSHFSLNSLLDINPYLIPDQSSTSNLRVNFNSIQSTSSMQNSYLIQSSSSMKNSYTIQGSNSIQNTNSMKNSNSMQNTNLIQSSSSMKNSNSMQNTNLIQSSSSMKNSYIIQGSNSNQNTNSMKNSNSMQNTNLIQSSNSMKNSYIIQGSNSNQNSNSMQNTNFIQSSISFSKENAISLSYFKNNLKLSRNFISDTNSSVDTDVSDNEHLNLSTNIESTSDIIGNEYLEASGNRHKNFGLDRNSDSYLKCNFNSKPKMDLSLNSNSEIKNVLNPIFPIQILTLLSTFTTVNDSYNLKIIRTINFFLKSYNSTHLNSLLLMAKGLPNEIFEAVLDILLNDNDISENPFSQLILLWSISWSNNFYESKEIIEKFIEVFINVTVGLSNNGLLFFTLTTTSSKNEEKIMTEYNVELTIFATVCFRTLSYLWNKFKEEKNECFPCCAYVDFSKHQELLRFSLLYAPLLNMSLFEPKSRNNFSDKLKLYSIQALSQFFSCCKVNNTYFLFNEISARFERIIYICPSILQHLLEHNFTEVFPIILQRSLKPNGTLYIKALAHFFRATKEGLKISISDILTKQQWTNLNPINRSSERLQIVYDNCGSFIFACILYIIISDSNVKSEVFILLITMSPILLLFEDGGKIENTCELLSQIAKICSELDHPTSNKEIDRLFGLGKILSLKFSFCTEQFLKSAFENLPLFKLTKMNVVLLSLVSWFETLNFEYDNRIFSRETDFQFINFSCYTFVENLVSSFPPPKDFSHPIYSIWKSLVIKNDKTNGNFLPTLHILFDIGEKEDENAKSLVNLIQFLFSLNSSTVMMFVTSRISFSNYFERHKNLIKKEKIQDNYRFIIKCLIRLCRQSIQTSFPYLNLIFSFSVVFQSFYFHEIFKLLKTVINSIEPFVTNKLKASYESLKSSLNRISSGFNTSESDIFSMKEKLNQANNYITDFDSNEIFNFLNDFDENLALGYSMELLRWGLCCGNLSFSSSALNAHPIILSEIVIGLTARALSNISLAIINTTIEKRSIYIKYIKSVISFLSSISEFMKNDIPNSAIFWISCELLKCPQKEIYIEALKLFDSFVSNESIFEFVNGTIPTDKIDEIYSGKRKLFTELSLFKFHSPWNEEYEGCLKYICLNAKSQFESAVNVLLHLLQIKYPKLLSNKSNGFSITILALLPYFWTNLSPFSVKNSSKKFTEIEKTIVSLHKIHEKCSQSLSKSILILMKSLEFSNKSKLRELMNNAADLLIKDMDESCLKMIAAFYTSALEFGQKQMMIPLVVIVTRIAQTFPSILKYLKNFSFLITKNEISSIKETTNLFSSRNNDIYEFLSLFNQLKEENKINKEEENKINKEEKNKTNEEEENKINKEEENKINEEEENKINEEEENKINKEENKINKEEENKINEEEENKTNEEEENKINKEEENKTDSNENNKLDFKTDNKNSNDSKIPIESNKNDVIDSSSTTFINNDDEDTFPTLLFFDRIVVVLIPHLFESNVGYQVNFEFNDLNLFPPLLPYDESIMSVEKFQNMQNFIQQIEIFPFIDWERIMEKMKFFVHDPSFVNQKLVTQTPQINISEILIDKFNKEIQKYNKIRESNEEEEEEDANDDYEDLQKLDFKESDAFNLVHIEARNFIPSIELANSIGDDLFDENNS